MATPPSSPNHVPDRGNSASGSGGGTGPSDPNQPNFPLGGRLNLLLSAAGWRPDSWADRLAPMLEPMGIRSFRAHTGREASSVIQSNRVHIAVVDLGLPLDVIGPASEEAGPRLLELLRRLDQPPPTVVITRGRGHRDNSREVAAALKAGAFAVIDRPSAPGDLELVLEVLRRCLGRFYQGRWPGCA